MMKNFTIISLSFLLVACGYVWYFTYDRVANASIIGDVEVSSNEALKTYLSNFAMDRKYKFIDQKIAVTSPEVFSIYLERKDILISATTVPNGTRLNIGFHKSKREKNRPDNATLNQLVNAISTDLAGINGVEIVEKNLAE